MARPLKLPRQRHRRFEATPLRVMLGQVRYEPLLKVGQRDFAAQFQELIKDEYPIMASQQEMAIMVGPEGLSSGSSVGSWKFSTIDSAWTVVLNPTFVALEADAPQYAGFDDFRERFIRLWDIVLEQVGPKRRVQQGLRYINHIEHQNASPKKWTKIISGHLLNAFAAEAYGDEFASGICDIRLARPDGQLSIKHGIVPAGPKNRLGYLLDFDYFSQQTTDVVSADAIGATFERFHEVIFRLFLWSLAPEYIRKMEGN